MKRSEINAALKEMEQMVKEYRFALPPFCNFTPQQCRKRVTTTTRSGTTCWLGHHRLRHGQL